MILTRRGFISMLGGAAGALIVPWREIKHPVHVLAPPGGWPRQGVLGKYVYPVYHPMARVTVTLDVPHAVADRMAYTGIPWVVRVPHYGLAVVKKIERRLMSLRPPPRNYRPNDPVLYDRFSRVHAEVLHWVPPAPNDPELPPVIDVKPEWLQAVDIRQDDWRQA